MAAGSLTNEQIGAFQDAFNKFCGADGSCHSASVSSIMRSLGQNPSEAEIQVLRLYPQKYSYFLQMLHIYLDIFQDILRIHIMHLF